ncbi:glycosyltransferase family 2 protein [Candidatus Parcubacteria bacterium]|nr:glycosyltransferase family 2 protein [Candidatus Parcubacteria bacterium]
MTESRHYLRVGRATDLVDSSERHLYRALEIFPGALAWVTLVFVVIGSAFFPVAIALFIIAFDVYWLLKTVYLSLHLRAAYRRLRVNLATDWRQKLEALPAHAYTLPIESWRQLDHLVILPMVDEGLEVVRPTMQMLAASHYPLEQLMVVLAIEARVGESARQVAQTIEAEFGALFGAFLVTVHPDGLGGEIRGKGSNETWAAREVKEKIVDPRRIPYEHIIASVFDVDTVVRPDFFACLTYQYLTTPNPTRKSFQPVPFYSNNIWQAPALARVVALSATFWHMMQQERPERQTTFSSHAMSFAPLVEIGFWQTNVVSEDSRIFWQCYLHLDGDWRVVPLYYPVEMDANLAPTFWQTMANVYKQQRRWGYGVENVPYFLYGFLKNKAVPFRKKLRFGFMVIEGFHAWATNALIIFLLGWLPLVLGGRLFNVTVLSANLPVVTRNLMTLSMIGLVSSAVLSLNLLPPRPPEYGRFRYLWMVLQWLFMPLTIIVFGALPGLEAQTRLMLGRYMGFWVTPKVRRSAAA